MTILRILLTLLPVLTLLNAFTLWPCSQDKDCIHFKFSRCDKGICKGCNANPNCKHIYQPTECTANNFCMVPCGPSTLTRCRAMHAICAKDKTGDKRCLGCSTNTDCYNDYNQDPTIKCFNVEGYGYCGYCDPSAIVCSTGQLCKNFRCVNCAASSECPANMPCISGRCGCTDPSHCNTVARPECVNKVCVPCQSDTSCKRFGFNKCKVSPGTCVECLGDGDCTDANKPICLSNVCSRCTSDLQCPSGKKCLTATGKCVDCINDSHCTSPSLKKCKTTTNQCVQCLHADNCEDPLKPICDNNQCIGCNSNYPCAAGFTCINNICQDCPNNEPCPLNKIVCSPPGICKPCQTNHDCISGTAGAQPFCKNGVCLGCASQADCGSTLGCTSAGTCEPCTSSSQCTPKVCDTIIFQCVDRECNSINDCIPYPTSARCDGIYCRPCLVDADCRFIANNLNKCHNGVCVRCNENSHCPSTEYCELTTRTCQPRQCEDPVVNICSPITPICNMPTFQCVKCKNNNDCISKDPAFPICTMSGTCQQCNSNDDCFMYLIHNREICKNGLCVGCSHDSDCTMSPRTLCNNVGACVECTDTPQCSILYPTTKPICRDFQCAPCINDGECTAFAPLSRCSPKGTCVECAQDSHCTDPIKKFCRGDTCQWCQTHDDCDPEKCDPITHQCYTAECTVSPHCQSISKSKCEDYRCEPCTQDEDCYHFVDTPFCKTSPGPAVCVECVVHDDCPLRSAPVCNGNNVCTPCTTDGDCTRFGVFDKCVQGTCIQCSSSSECPFAQPICRDGECVSCQNSNECAQYTSRPYCQLGSCYQCLSTPDCRDLGASKCQSGLCTPCIVNSDCSHFNLPNQEAVCYQATQICIVCSPFCIDCDSSTNCIQCKPGYNVINGECGIICPPGWNKDIDGTCKELCGDGVRRTQLPYCDDGNRKSGDGCSATCSVEPGWKCLDGGKYSRDKCYVIPVMTISQDLKNTSIVNINFNKRMKLTQDPKMYFDIKLQDGDPNEYAYSIKQINEQHYQIIFEVSSRIVEPILIVTLIDPDNTKDYENLNLEQTVHHLQLRSIHTDIGLAGLVASATQVAAAGSMITSGTLLLSGLNPAIIWGLLNLLQIFYYLLFINTEYPINVQIFLRIFAMGRLEFLPNPIENLTANIEKEKLPTPSKFQENVMNSLFLWNAGSMLLVWGVMIITFLLANLFLKCLNALPPKIRKMLENIKNNFEWSGALRTWITSYMDLTLSAFLQLAQISFDSSIRVTSSITAIIVSGLNILLPIGIIIKIRNNIHNPESLKPRYAALIEEYKMTPRGALFFYCPILIRRAGVAAALALLQSWIYVQLSLLTALNIIILGLLILYPPYHSKRDLVINILVNEIAFLIIHILVIVIARDNDSRSFSESTRIGIGWIIISCCILTLLVTFFVLLSLQAEQILQFYRKIMQAYSKSNSEKKPFTHSNGLSEKDTKFPKPLHLAPKKRVSSIDTKKQKIRPLKQYPVRHVLENRKSGSTENLKSAEPVLRRARLINRTRNRDTNTSEEDERMKKYFEQKAKNIIFASD